MPNRNFLSRIVSKLLVNSLSLEENRSRDIGYPKNVMIVRQHNQFGDLLASVSLFRAVKETFPDAHLTVIVSPDNYYAVTKNQFIDEYFLFDKTKLFNPVYFIKFLRILRRKYDVSIVPATVSISFTSCIIGRLVKSPVRIGPASLDGKKNKYAFLFDRRVELDWRKHPDSHISDFGLEIIRPFGINTKNYRTNILFDDTDLNVAEKFLKSFLSDNQLVLGFHIGAGKPANRWALMKFANLIHKLNDEYSIKCYITGSNSDKNELDFMKQNLNINVEYFINHTIPELAALIFQTDLFVTNDTGVMHVAGATDTQQISIFGPTNPYNWAPIGPGKYFIRKSELIDDVTVGDVFNLCKMILDNQLTR